MDSKLHSDCWYKEVCQLECKSACLRYTEMKHLMDSSGIPKSKQIPTKLDAGIDYDSFIELDHIKKTIVDFVNEGKSLYLCSSHTGNGKTSWALKIMLKFFDNIWAGNGLRTRGLFIHTPTLLLQCKNFSNPLSQDYIDNILNSDLVIWDDIGILDISNYDLSQLLMYIDYRVLHGKSNIFTSNKVTCDELANVVGERLASRVWLNSTHKIELRGKDRRNGTVADNFKDTGDK